MKQFKKLSAAMLLAALGMAGSAMAADDLSVTGGVHGATGYQYRGIQFSDGEASIGAHITAAHSSGLYGTLKTDTIKLTEGTGRHQFQSALTVGYTESLSSGLKVNGGFTRNIFSGKDHASVLSFSEAFVGANWNGVSGKISTVVEGAKLQVPGFSQGDTYGELGYTHTIGKYSVGGDVGYNWYDSKNIGTKNGLALAQVRATYAINKQTHVMVAHQFAGDDAYGDTNTGAHKTVLKFCYMF